MRRIRSKGMKPEMIVRRLAHGMGYRYTLHSPKLPGKPDLVFPKRKKIIEVRGCFWHQHRGCVDSHIPKSSTNYWVPKLKRNKERDSTNLRKLRTLGWKVLVVWECSVASPDKVTAEIREFLGR